jgi:hypothetical protein
MSSLSATKEQGCVRAAPWYGMALYDRRDCCASLFATRFYMYRSFDTLVIGGRHTTGAIYVVAFGD